MNKGTWTRLARDIIASDEDLITLEVEPRSGFHPLPGNQLVLASSDLDQGQAEVLKVVAVHNSSVWEVRVRVRVVDKPARLKITTNTKMLSR